MNEYIKSMKIYTQKNIFFNWLICFFYSFLCIILFNLGGISQAQDNSTTAEIESELAIYQANLADRSAELERIQTTLGDLAIDLAKRIAERDEISQTLVELRRDKTSLSEEIASLETQIVDNETRIASLEEHLTKLEDHLQAMLVSLHKQRGNRYASTFAKSESFFELRVRNHYLAELSAQDVNILQDIRTTVKQISNAQTQLAEQVSDRNEKLAGLEQTEVKVTETAKNLDDVIEELETSREGQLALRQDTINRQTGLEITIANARNALNAERSRLRAEAEAARKRAEETKDKEDKEKLLNKAEQTDAAATALVVPSKPLEDGYVHPFKNPKLTKKYGEEGPYVFLRAEQDYNAVKAVKSGVVQIVQPVQANTGYLVVVAHDSELLSAYQNLQGPQLEIGDWVNQGDVIGYLGGGTLIPANTLKFFIGIAQSSGGAAWVDPSKRLGF